MQEQFNTDSLANDKATQEIITNANKLIENDIHILFNKTTAKEDNIT